MNRLLLFVIALYVVWRVLTIVGKRLTRRAAGSEDFSRFSARRRGREGEASASGVTPTESLAACSVCGTLVPASRMLQTDGGSPVCGSSCLGAAGPGPERGGDGQT